MTNNCFCGFPQSDGPKYLADPWIATIYFINELEKIRLPLCMGALISHKHILTSKFCFGTGDGDSYELRWSEDKLKDIIKVMLGAGESYPWGFPHTTKLDVVQESLDSSIIVWSDVEEVKQLPNEVFCILTMQKYVPIQIISIKRPNPNV